MIVSLSLAIYGWLVLRPLVDTNLADVQTLMVNDVTFVWKLHAFLCTPQVLSRLCITSYAW